MMIRVDYTRLYQIKLEQDLTEYYEFQSNITNDISQDIFDALRKNSSFIQLVYYKHEGKILFCCFGDNVFVSIKSTVF